MASDGRGGGKRAGEGGAKRPGRCVFPAPLRKASEGNRWARLEPCGARASPSASADLGAQRDGRGTGGGALRRHAAGHGAAARGRRAGGKRRGPRPGPSQPWIAETPPPPPASGPRILVAGPHAPTSGPPTPRAKSHSHGISARHLAPRAISLSQSDPKASRIHSGLHACFCLHFNDYSLGHPWTDSPRRDFLLNQK